MNCKKCNQRLVWAGMKWASCHKCARQWHTGIPTEEGIYWFDPIGNKEFLFVAQAYLHKDEMKVHIFGRYGSGPGHYFYNNETKHMKFMEIPSHDKWQKMKDVCDKTYMWVKDPGGYIAFGLLKSGNHNDMRGTLVWLTFPKGSDRGSDHGVCINEKDGYSFCPVEVPRYEGT